MRVASKPSRTEPQGRQPYGLVPSIATLSVVLLLFVVLLLGYTNVFNSWLAWVMAPAVVALVAHDIWLRARRRRREDRWRV